MAFNEKQTAYGRSLFYVFPTFGAQATMALNNRRLFVRKTTRKVMIKNSRFLDETQTFSRERSNSKRARSKFKLIGKFKMLRKFLKTVTEGLAFLARSLVFFTFAHLFAFVWKQEK